MSPSEIEAMLKAWGPLGLAIALVWTAVTKQSKTPETPPTDRIDELLRRVADIDKRLAVVEALAKERNRVEKDT